MTPTEFLRRLPGPLWHYILHFEGKIENSVSAFAASLAPGARVLDAGAGEGRYARFFNQQRYCGVDLCVGDRTWDYGRLNAVADIANMPFRSGCFDACLNIVTLEHVSEPTAALREMGRALKPGGRLLLAIPHEWEVHQSPYDFYRFTRHGIEYLLEKAGFTEIKIEPAGGYFRLLSRRLLSGILFFPPLLVPVAALFLVPPALVLPVLDFLDRERNFTLGYLCTAVKR